MAIKMSGYNDGTYGISGIPPPRNVEFKTKTIPYAPGMPVRLRLSDLAAANTPKKRRQWTLFILALERFKALPVEQKLSYFQIAGIHGYPATSWDGADPPSTVPVDSDDEPLYCSHNCVTFPTWHRPYMLLYEKRLWYHMKEIIKSWDTTESQASEWNEAADTWRLPYWDWAQRQTYNNSFSLPEVFTMKTVRIYNFLDPEMVENDRGIDYPNPLWGFENPEQGPDDKPLRMGEMPAGEMPAGKEKWNIRDNKALPLQWGQCSGVSRYGIFKAQNGTLTGLEGVNNFTVANEWINSFSTEAYNPYPKDHEDYDKWVAPGSLADAVNRMFSKDYNQTWATFASTKWWEESEDKISTGYISLEYIHNNVHNLAGGQNFKTGLGHMSDVPVAAFDPLFWLHHCNVDRLLSMWQVLHWDAWWTAPGSCMAADQDPMPKDPLKPFHTKDNGDPKKDYWTSEMARDWTKLYYQYDDLVPDPGAISSDGTLDENKYRQDLETHIEKIYPSTKNYIQGIRLDNKIKNSDFFEVGDGHSWDDYIVNVIYDRYALDGLSYAIQFWLGDNMVGQVYAFAGLAPGSAESGGCANCGSQRDNKVLSRAQVPLTVPIMVLVLGNPNGPLRSMKQQEVRDYLAANLHWKFVELGGALKPASDFPNTKISLWRGIGKPQNLVGGDRLPAAFSSYRPLPDITNDKECGLKQDDRILGDHASYSFRRF
ncbi:common central domain of tyrosinase-domain-containing protein [Daldinia vernicosa]|uniref:common central domain of tyrosinase-domain-containing protein n=1 Tax=Daldinia vernicosa TaxID=114800 RepID=UPI002008CFC8|nr:common central domain of tyrosinase-domain-containing protein [Daldinia vernicosa]KAI0850711.1 common central domain of tyrosinase-domain-containing protein [Daldinia vernicosa]